MNITTSYPLQQSYTRSNQNKSLNTAAIQHNQNVNGASAQVNFTGLKIPRMFEKKVKLDSDTMYLIEEAANVLNTDTKSIIELAKTKTVKEMSFFSSMVEHFNGQNFYLPKSEKENGQVVIDLFKRIESPQPEHFNFVHNTSLTMTDIKACFDKCKDKPQEIKKLHTAYEKMAQVRDYNGVMRQIVDSPNTQEYVENIDKYVDHFRAHENTKGIIAELDAQMNKGTVDIVSKKKEKNIARISQYFPETDALNADVLRANYNETGNSLLFQLSNKLNPTRESLEKGDAEGIIRIYSSTTPENVDFRTNFLDINYCNYGQREKFGEDELKELSALFELADKDPKVMKLLSGFADREVHIASADEYVKMIDTIGTDRLNQNLDPVIKAIRKHPYKSASESAISLFEEEAKNPVKRIITTIADIFRGKPKKEAPVMERVHMERTVKPANTTFEINNIAPQETEVISLPPIYSQAASAEEEIQPLVQTIIEDTPKPVRSRKSSITYTPVVPKQPDAKKLAVISDVDGVIRKKLGAKTYDEQARIYANKATKMRLSLLPEIFESIKETRAAERANGTFKKHSSVSNADAVDLYTRINGKNKKLVNYMLKKRNADGTRTFTVRDIMDTLADANRSILDGKAQSTKLNRFTAKDERAIYDKIFEAKVDEFGKLARVRKTNSNK